MKILIALLISISALAESYVSPPVGATSSVPVIYTDRVHGRVISLGEPIQRAIPAGQTCYQEQVPQQPSTVNPGTVIGAIVGGVVGSRFGGGNGREVAIGVGAATGAVAGGQVYNGSNTQNCQPTFQTVIVGYPYTASYGNIQVRGISSHPLQIGDDVEVIIKSYIYGGQ